MPMTFRFWFKKKKNKEEKNDQVKNKVKCSACSDIPGDVLLQIFYKSPVKSVIRFSCVSKLWFNLINNHQQQFNKFYLVESQKKPILICTLQDHGENKKLYYLEKQVGNTYKLHQKNEILDKYMIGYDNGLACYWNLKRHEVYGQWFASSLEIYNPSRLEKLIVVSCIPLRNTLYENIWGFRFGYDILNNEYKVMRIMKYDDEYECYMFTLGSTKPWRQIHNPWPKQCPFGGTPISCNGTLYYQLLKDKQRVDPNSTAHYIHIYTLVAFDLHYEKFQMIKFPSDDEFLPNNYSDLYPFEYKGCFCYALTQIYDLYEGEVILHILKDTDKHVWVKETITFHLPRELKYPPTRADIRFLSFSNQLILVWRTHYVVKFYNVHSEELSEVKIPNEYSDNFRTYYISSHVENFLSLKTLETTSKDEAITRKVMQAWNKEDWYDIGEDMLTSNSEVISFLDPAL